MTTKIHVVTDALGRPLRFILSGGQAHDITTAPHLLSGLSAGGVIADKAFDSNALRDLIAEAGSHAVIPLERRAKSLFRMTQLPIGSAIESSASSTNSSISVTSPRATTAVLSTSSPSCISPVL